MLHLVKSEDEEFDDEEMKASMARHPSTGEPTGDTFTFADEWLPLGKSNTPRTSTLELDDLTVEACAEFDYEVSTIAFYPWEAPVLPQEWGIGVIVGASGTGKSLLLETFGELETPEWNPTRSVISHFNDAQSAKELMYAVGLSAVPTWAKPYQVLSNGEKFRVDLARQIKDNAVIDEFTSVVDRTVAKSASNTFQKYVRTNNVRNVVIATCHRDVLEWLQPDWIIDTDAGMYCLQPKECLQRQPLVAEVYEVRHSMWDYFVEHHYLNDALVVSARCYLAVIDGVPACFGSVLALPSGTLKSSFRGHRLVTKPDFQGLGLGVRLSDWQGEQYRVQGNRYFSKTTHPRLGQYRDNSPLWKATSKNHHRRSDVERQKLRSTKFSQWKTSGRMSYSHEYVGYFTKPHIDHPTLETPLD